jgi:hypothetical protein
MLLRNTYETPRVSAIGKSIFRGAHCLMTQYLKHRIGKKEECLNGTLDPNTWY